MKGRTKLSAKGGKGKREDEGEIEIESVRVDAANANAPVVAIEGGCGSIAELLSCAGEDGVFRGS